MHTIRKIPQILGPPSWSQKSLKYYGYCYIKILDTLSPSKGSKAIPRKIPIVQRIKLSMGSRRDIEIENGNENQHDIA